MAVATFLLRSAWMTAERWPLHCGNICIILSQSYKMYFFQLPGISKRTRPQQVNLCVANKIACLGLQEVIREDLLTCCTSTNLVLPLKKKKNTVCIYSEETVRGGNWDFLRLIMLHMHFWEFLSQGVKYRYLNQSKKADGLLLFHPRGFFSSSIT